MDGGKEALEWELATVAHIKEQAHLLMGHHCSGSYPHKCYLVDSVLLVKTCPPARG